MFRKNSRHLQIPLTSHVDELPEPLRKRLRNSWAETFYQQFFCRLDETPFEVLYADVPSRPNVPVNVLVSLEFLKAANGWTDEELYDNACFDVLVRYAIGYRQLSEGDFDLRTLYSFRERLSRSMQETGINLLDQAFAQVTDAQIHAFSLKTGKQRMDSTLLASNMRRMGRVQLLVTVLQRVHGMVSEADQSRYAGLFEPYLKGHAGQYVYRLKAEEIAEHLQRIGEDMRRLLSELEAEYHTHPTYAVLARVFVEHFRVAAERLEVKKGNELSASSLQSPDDPEAASREKHGRGVQGFSANLSQTCDPDTPFQLITHTHVAPANTDDTQFLLEALPRLQERTEGDTIITDGAYANQQTDALLQEQGIPHIQTALRGRAPDENRLALHDFDFTCDESGRPQQLTCPNGQTVPVTPSDQSSSFLACFPQERCQACPLREKCPVVSDKKRSFTRLRFDLPALRRALRRKIAQASFPHGHNLRAAIEAIVRSVKHPFPAGKLPGRGLFRAACMVMGSAAVSNVRQIHRYLRAQKKAEHQGGQKEQTSSQAENTLAQAADMIFSLFRRLLPPPWRLVGALLGG